MLISNRRNYREKSLNNGTTVAHPNGTKIEKQTQQIGPEVPKLVTQFPLKHLRCSAQGIAS